MSEREITLNISFDFSVRSHFADGAKLSKSAFGDWRVKNNLKFLVSDSKSRSKWLQKPLAIKE